VIQSIAVLTPLYVCAFWGLVFLNSNKKKNRARYFLGFFMVAAFFLYLGHSLFFIGRFDLYIHYDPLYIAASLLVYPMYYQYIRLLTVDTHWNGKYLLHYIPALIIGISVFLLHQIMHNEIHFSNEQYFKESYNLSPDFTSPFFLNRLVYGFHRAIFFVQVVGYFIAGYFLIKKYRGQIKDYYSNYENRSMTWVNNILLTLAIVSTSSFVFNIIGKFTFLHEEKSLLIPSILFSGMIFLIGYLANGQNQVIREIVQSDSIESKDLVNISKPLNKEIDLKLKNLFITEKIHLNPDLTIWDVSRILGTNRTYLSNYINKHYGVSFSMFVNSYRVADSKKLFEEKEGSLYSLEVIGEKCGFGSYNNFIRVFRELEKVTPGRYRDFRKLPMPGK
jgi:AraC-like DNA-binding protein